MGKGSRDRGRPARSSNIHKKEVGGTPAVPGLPTYGIGTSCTFFGTS
jgi:hypothetical protein